MPWRRWTAASQPATMAGDRASEHRSGSPGGHKRSARHATVAIEEHFTAPHLVARIDARIGPRRRGYQPRRIAPGAINPMELAADIGKRRLGLMDEAGITMQVLSNTGPGPDLLPGPEGVALAAAMNDYLAECVARAPDRFAGFRRAAHGQPRKLRRGADTRRCGPRLQRCADQRDHRWALFGPSGL